MDFLIVGEICVRQICVRQRSIEMDSPNKKRRKGTVMRIDKGANGSIQLTLSRSCRRALISVVMAILSIAIDRYLA